MKETNTPRMKSDGANGSEGTGQKEMDEETQFKDTKYPHLRLATGFKDGDGEVPTGNWLLDMEIGTVFLAHDKNAQNPLEEEYVLVNKTEKTANLKFDDHRGNGFVRVNAELFIRFKVFDEVIGK